MNIRNFVVKIVIYIVLVLCMILPIEFYKISRSYVDFKNINGSDVYVSINKSKSKTKKYKILLLGDSVGKQLYDNTEDYDDIYSLACNYAISMAGHYFLLHNYLECNIDSLPEKVILLCTPRAFGNDLDIYAYQYFLKPFYTDEYKCLFSETLLNRIKHIPFYWTTQLPLIKTSNYSVSYEMPVEDYSFVSPITEYYLNQIISECRINEIEFQIYSAPLNESQKSSIDRKRNEAIKRHEFDAIDFDFNSYFDSFTFWPDSCFIDGVHLWSNNIPSDYLNLLE